jgi:hypothetical protein
MSTTDYTAVPSPTNYGAPNVFQQQQPAQGAQGQQQQQNPASALLAKAKQLMSQGQISSDQYNQLMQKYGSQSAELGGMGGNMGSTNPAGAPLNILPGQTG